MSDLEITFFNARKALGLRGSVPVTPVLGRPARPAPRRRGRWLFKNIPRGFTASDVAVLFAIAFIAVFTAVVCWRLASTFSG